MKEEDKDNESIGEEIAEEVRQGMEEVADMGRDFLHAIFGGK